MLINVLVLKGALSSANHYFLLLTPQLNRTERQLSDGIWLCRAYYPLRSSKITVKRVEVFATQKNTTIITFALGAAHGSCPLSLPTNIIFIPLLILDTTINTPRPLVTFGRGDMEREGEVKSFLERMKRNLGWLFDSWWNFWWRCCSGCSRASRSHR